MKVKDMFSLSSISYKLRKNGTLRVLSICSMSAEKSYFYTVVTRELSFRDYLSKKILFSDGEDRLLHEKLLQASNKMLNRLNKEDPKIFDEIKKSFEKCLVELKSK